MVFNTYNITGVDQHIELTQSVELRTDAFVYCDGGIYLYDTKPAQVEGKRTFRNTEYPPLTSDWVELDQSIKNNLKQHLDNLVNSGYISLSENSVAEFKQHIDATPMYRATSWSMEIGPVGSVPSSYEVLGNGACSGIGSILGKQLEDNWNRYFSTEKHISFGDTVCDSLSYFEMPFMYNILQRAQEENLIEMSEELQNFIDLNAIKIPTDKSVHFDVYIKGFKTNPVMGGYETSSVVVRWENLLVDSAPEEDEEYNYQANNTVIHIGVTDRLQKVNINKIDDILYGQLEYAVPMNKLQSVAGGNSAIDFISALVPSLEVGDVYLTLGITFNNELSRLNDMCVAQIPLNKTNNDPTNLKTLQGDRGSTVTIHYADEDGYIPEISEDRNGWGKRETDLDDQFKEGINESDLDSSIGFNSIYSLMSTTYAISEQELQEMGHILWSDGFMDNIQLVNNSPIENIISCKAFPFTIVGGSASNVKLGNVNMEGVTANKIPSNYVPIKQIGGEFTIPKKYQDGLHNYLDIVATSVTFYLPYIGFREVNVTEFKNDTKFKLQYIYDLITGVCTACLYYKDGSNWIEFEKFSGNIGIDIPISASNRAQVEASYIQGGINAIASFAGGFFNGFMGTVNAGLNALQTQYHTSTSGAPSPSCDGFDEQTAYMIINRPVYYEPSKYGHEYGYPCNLTLTLANCKGFTKCKNVDVDNLYCTERERQEIKAILESGCYL